MAKIKVDKERCKGCLICISVCPKKLIKLSSDFNKRGLNYVVFEDKAGDCTGCTLCAIVCPDVAIEVEK